MPECQIVVGVEFDKVVAFLSAFLVDIPIRRLEIDLIVVHPNSQEKGIGTSLIEKVKSYGSNLGIRCANASIRVDNYASQRAFSKAGFSTDNQVCRLIAWDPLDCQSATHLPEPVNFIPVDTLTYRGLWIEGLIESSLSHSEQHNLIRAAQSRVFHENRLNTGMLIPNRMKHTFSSDVLTSATDFGEYQRWEMHLHTSAKSLYTFQKHKVGLN